MDVLLIIGPIHVMNFGLYIFLYAQHYNSQTVRFVNCKWIPKTSQKQNCCGILKTFLIFFAIFDSTDKQLKHFIVQESSKNWQLCRIRNKICGIRNCKWNPQIVRRIRTLYVYSANCERYPQIVSVIRIICGIY